MLKYIQLISLIFTLLISLFLAACGGGSSGDTANTQSTNEVYVSGFINPDKNLIVNATSYREVESVYFDIDNDGVIDIEDVKALYIASNNSNNYMNAFTTLELSGLSLEQIDKLTGISLQTVDLDMGAITDLETIKAHIKAIIIINDILDNNKIASNSPVSRDNTRNALNTLSSFFSDSEFDKLSLSNTANEKINRVETSNSIEALVKSFDSDLNMNVSQKILSKDGTSEVLELVDKMTDFILDSASFIDKCAPLASSDVKDECTQLVNYLSSPFIYDFLSVQYTTSQLNALGKHSYWLGLASDGKEKYINKVEDLTAALSSIANQVSHTITLRRGCGGEYYPNPTLTPQYQNAIFSKSVFTVETLDSNFQSSLKYQCDKNQHTNVDVFNYALAAYHLLRINPFYHSNQFNNINDMINTLKCNENVESSTLNKFKEGIDLAILSELATTPHIDNDWLSAAEYDFFKSASDKKIYAFQQRLAETANALSQTYISGVGNLADLSVPDFLFNLETGVEKDPNELSNGFLAYTISTVLDNLPLSQTSAINDTLDLYEDYADWSNDYLDNIASSFDKGYFLEEYFERIKAAQYTTINYNIDGSSSNIIHYIPKEYGDYVEYLMESKESLDMECDQSVEKKFYKWLPDESYNEQSPSYLTYYDAVAYCEEKDGRLPTRNEITETYLDDGGNNKQIPDGFKVSGPYFIDSYFFLKNYKRALGFNFSYGVQDITYSHSLDKKLYVRCVKDIPVYYGNIQTRCKNYPHITTISPFELLESELRNIDVYSDIMSAEEFASAETNTLTYDYAGNIYSGHLGFSKATAGLTFNFGINITENVSMRFYLYGTKLEQKSNNSYGSDWINVSSSHNSFLCPDSQLQGYVTIAPFQLNVNIPDVKNDSRFYRDNTTETVYDKHLNLTWQDDKEVETNKLEYGPSEAYCDRLNLGNDTSWRLPTYQELLSIKIDSYPYISSAFNSIYQGYYWSDNGSYLGERLAVNFNSIETQDLEKVNGLDVFDIYNKYNNRCVKNGILGQDNSNENQTSYITLLSSSQEVYKGRESSRITFDLDCSNGLPNDIKYTIINPRTFKSEMGTLKEVDDEDDDYNCGKNIWNFYINHPSSDDTYSESGTYIYSMQPIYSDGTSGKESNELEALVTIDSGRPYIYLKSLEQTIRDNRPAVKSTTIYDYNRGEKVKYVKMEIVNKDTGKSASYKSSVGSNYQWTTVSEYYVYMYLDSTNNADVFNKSGKYRVRTQLILRDETVSDYSEWQDVDLIIN